MATVSLFFCPVFIVEEENKSEEHQQIFLPVKQTENLIFVDDVFNHDEKSIPKNKSSFSFLSSRF